jgi:type IV secretory system conjugative DNA transfer VirD4/TraG family protein
MFASTESSHGASQSEGRSEREVPLLTVRELAELDDEEILVFHRGYKPIRARRMGITDYPVLHERHLLAPPPLPLLAPLPLPPLLPSWQHQPLPSGQFRLKHGANRLDAGAYPLPPAQ